MAIMEGMLRAGINSRLPAHCAELAAEFRVVMLADLREAIQSRLAPAAGMVHAPMPGNRQSQAVATAVLS